MTRMNLSSPRKQVEEALQRVYRALRQRKL